MTWAVEFYEEEDGNFPVEDFLAKLSKEHRRKAVAIVQRLKEAGPTLPFPYSSQVKGKLRELRTQYGKDKIRILYFADRQRRFILLHAFMKRTEKLSVTDIEIAERRMKQHERESGNPAGQKRKSMRAKSHPTGSPFSHHLEDPRFEIIEEEGVPKWVRIGGQFGEVEIEFWHEIEERKGIKGIEGTPKLIRIGGRFGEGEFEIRPVEQGFMMKGGINCGPLEMILYPDPDFGPDLPQPMGGIVSGIKHRCERAEDDCILEEFRQEMGIKITPLM